MKISMIGSGNVATILGRKMVACGHDVVSVFSPERSHAETLAAKLNARCTSDWGEIREDADLYVIAITDSALQKISEHLHLGKKLVVHTAGSVSLHMLNSVSRNYGVIYPLQSLLMELENIPPMPLLIDANTTENLTLIHDFARTLSVRVELADDIRRMKLHLAAVIVNNFSNHIYAQAEMFCKNEELDFSILWPLIQETISRLMDISPEYAQTGPAVRDDQETIAKHLELLREYPALRDLYRTLTRSIELFKEQG